MKNNFKRDHLFKERESLSLIDDLLVNYAGDGNIEFGQYLIDKILKALEMPSSKVTSVTTKV